jgi:hypothetical protein
MKKEIYPYWKISPGREGFLWREQKLNECIALGWVDVGDLSGKTKTDMESMKHKGETFTSYAANQLNAFVNEVQIGHKVIASASGKGIYAVGTVIGDYEFNEELEYKHSRKVRWETTFWNPVDIRRLNLQKSHKSLYNKLHGQSSQAIRNLDKDEWEFFSHRLDKISTPFRNLGMWGGLIQAPEYENEVIILFSHMLQHLHMRIIRSGVLFPDAIVEQKKGDKWQKINVEFELRSSGFRSHLPDKEGKCDLIVCWEDDDWGRDNHQKRRYKDKIIELKKDLEKIL